MKSLVRTEQAAQYLTEYWQKINGTGLINFAATESEMEEVNPLHSMENLMLMADVSRKEIKFILAAALERIKQLSSVGRTLTDEMVLYLCEILTTEYRGMSLTSILRAFRNGLNGNYGEVYRLDVTVVMGWIRTYNQNVDYRLQLFRENVQRERDEELREMSQSDTMLKLYKSVLKVPVKPKQFRSRPEIIESFTAKVQEWTDDKIKDALVQYRTQERSVDMIQVLENELSRRGL